jgi:hypothetical protein
VTAGLIVLGTLLVIAAAMAVALLFVLRWARSAREELHRSLRTERAQLEDDARLVGVRSRGLVQVRGTGTLALTARELVFVMWVPRRELRIPREAIESAQAGHGLPGYRSGGEVLHVRWHSTGALDEAAFGVRNLGDWLAALRS